MKNAAFFLFAMCLAGGIASAQDQGKSASSKKMPSMTVEQRKKMADAHEKMAACLRSDKPQNECQKEMMKECRAAMGKSGCPMMGGKGMGSHHGMMNDST